MTRLKQYCCNKCGATRTYPEDKVIKANCNDCLVGEMKEIQREGGDGGLVAE